MSGQALFPPGFVWGTATASYQVEGAVREAGRGLSIWDTYCHSDGRIANGDNGDVACDHFHRFREDVALMAELGMPAYRLSMAWPRVQPDGKGPINEEGMDFYRRLVDELLDAGIEPWITLYHWDLPQALEDAGGWPERDTAFRFADYAAAAHAILGDRVSQWITLNEPWCSSFLGYGSGAHAPGRTEPEAAVRAAHHLLLGHGAAVEALRAGPERSQVGITLNLYPVTPASDSEPDRDAARRIDGLANRFFLDPVLRGELPPDVVEDLDAVTAFDHVLPADLSAVAAPVDFLGVNYYSRHVVAGPAGAASTSASAWPGSEGVRFVGRGLPTTAMGWEIDATGMSEVLLRLKQDYPPLPLYITENGAAFEDVLVDARVDDIDRVGYLDGHLRACHEAIQAGVPLAGYFAWSFMDNFEWAHGYAKRFGLVHVDHATQARTIKGSGRWFSAVVARNGLDGQVESAGDS